jgi:hypothetical protein
MPKPDRLLKDLFRWVREDREDSLTDTRLGVFHYCGRRVSIRFRTPYTGKRVPVSAGYRTYRHSKRYLLNVRLHHA